MVKLLKLQNGVLWIAFLLAFLLTFLIATTHAQTPSALSPEDEAAKYGVTFPIADLGNCGSYSECRSFCEDPTKHNACISYGRSKGFYEGESDEKVRTVLAQARTTLGCDSYASCQNFCEVPANHDRCATFASSQGITGGYIDDPSKATILAKAREVLGCSSADACRSYCEQEANRDKCSNFAQQTGLAGGEHQVGPGGCTSEATCKSFCSDPNNYQICSGFASTSGGTFTGPGGCNSEASCRTYCQEHEDECRASFGGPGPGGSPPPGYNLQEMCNRTPNCSWAGNTCQCGFYGETQQSQQKAGEYAAFCQVNHDKCKPGQTGGFESPQQRQEFESYCRQNPDKCKPPTGGTTGTGYYGDPATECVRYGCTWANNSCQCTNIAPSGTPPPGTGGSGTYSPAPASTYYPTGTSYPTATYQPSSYDPATECAKQSGCSWTGSSCQCSSTGGSSGGTTTSTSQPASTTQPSSTESSGGSSGGTTTSCPEGYYLMDGNCVKGVQGVSTTRNFWDQILDFLDF